LLNPGRYPKGKMEDFQKAYSTRKNQQNINELKRIQEAENKLENRMESRSAKNK
jgi:uncharacterized membrane protein (DUF106 family)